EQRKIQKVHTTPPAPARKNRGYSVRSPLASRDAPGLDQVSKNDGFERLRRGDSRIPPAAAIGHRLDRIGVFVEGPRVALARFLVEVEFQGGAGLGIAQFQFADPWRHAIL